MNMGCFAMWLVLTLVSVAFAQDETSLVNPISGPEASLVMEELRKLTEMINNQKEELLAVVQAKIENQLNDNISRNDVATLMHLLDTDQCADLTHNCSLDARCTDTMVSFRCKCKSGFNGDGYSCEDIDECEESNRCGPYSSCINTPGRYTCSCNQGFRGKGKDCEDIDECSDETHKCHNHAICTNTIGGYDCTCTFYHEGDGFNCQPTEEYKACQEPFQFIVGVGCIHIIDKSQTFAASKAQCKKMDSDLFVAEDKDHYLRLAKHFIDTNQKDIKKYMWVGVKEGVWLNGRRVEPEEEAPKNPTMRSGTCSYTDGDANEKFLLWTDPCDEDWWAICEKKVIEFNSILPNGV